MTRRTTTPEELPLRPEYEDEWEEEEAEDEGEEEELETAEGGDILKDRTWKLHEGQIERIKAKDGEACALFVEENRKTVDNMVFKYLRQHPDMKAYFTDTNGRIAFDLFYNQLILDLPHLAYNNGGTLYTTMYRDSICKAYWGYEYIQTDAAKNGNKHASLVYQIRKASETLMPSYYEDWRQDTEHGNESDKHPLDLFCMTESVADEYNAKRGDAPMTAAQVVGMLFDFLNDRESELLRYILQGVTPKDIQSILGITSYTYRVMQASLVKKLRTNAAEVVARLTQNGSTRATSYIGIYPDGFDEQEKERKKARKREWQRARRAEQSTEEHERERAIARERERQKRASRTPEELEAYRAAARSRYHRKKAAASATGASA